MGLVLAFDTSSRPAARPPLKRVQPAESADILFFTGVRYERPGDILSPQSQPSIERADPTPAS